METLRTRKEKIVFLNALLGGTRTVEELQNEWPELWFQETDEDFKPLDIFAGPKKQILNRVQLDERGKKRRLIIFVPAPGSEPIRDDNELQNNET